MFEKETYIRYGNHGVFQIKDIITKKIGKERKRYYVMEAVYGVSTRITTPVDNPNIREILSADAIAKLLEEMPDIKAEWMEDKRLRHEHFRAMIASNDPLCLAQVIKSIYEKRQEKETQNKQLSEEDLSLFQLAEDILADEICIRLHIEKAQVANYILNNVAVKELSKNK